MEPDRRLSDAMIKFSSILEKIHVKPRKKNIRHFVLTWYEVPF